MILIDTRLKAAEATKMAPSTRKTLPVFASGSGSTVSRQWRSLGRILMDGYDSMPSFSFSRATTHILAPTTIKTTGRKARETPGLPRAARCIDRPSTLTSGTPHATPCRPRRPAAPLTNQTSRLMTLRDNLLDRSSTELQTSSSPRTSPSLPPPPQPAAPPTA